MQYQHPLAAPNGKQGTYPNFYVPMKHFTTADGSSGSFAPILYVNELHWMLMERYGRHRKLWREVVDCVKDELHTGNSTS